MILAVDLLMNINSNWLKHGYFEQKKNIKHQVIIMLNKYNFDVMACPCTTSTNTTWKSCIK